MVRWSGLIHPILVIIGFILGLVALGFGGNFAINLVQKSRLEARIQIQENLIFRLFCGENEVKKRIFCNLRFLLLDGHLTP